MTTITLKNIPDDLYEQLKSAARLHRRSINSELITCLERVFYPKQVSSEERLRRLREIRPKIDPNAISLEELQQAIDSGRP